jgi:hypothetical protein
VNPASDDSAAAPGEPAALHQGTGLPPPRDDAARAERRQQRRNGGPAGAGTSAGKNATQ